MNRLFRYIEKNRSRLVDLTKELISIKTVNPPGENYAEMASFLKRRCECLGLKTRQVIAPRALLKKYGIRGASSRINLLADWRLGNKRLLHINGHYDVVPVTNNWSSDPFKPVVKNGRIYGRGAEDMKGNIACALMAIEALKVQGISPSCDIQLSFSPDEESGGKTGFEYLIKQGIVKPDYAIGEGYHTDFLSYGNKGIMWLRVEVRGRSCHSCEPYKGINSFEKMIVVANELMKLKKRVAGKSTAFAVKRRADSHPTMVMGGELWGGRKTNIVPDRSVFTIDRRIIPEERMEDVRDEILGAIRGLERRDKDLKVKVDIITEESPAVCDRKGRLFSEFSNSIEKVLGRKAACALLAGATDMRFLMRKGIPCAGYSVDGGNTCHSDNEYVKIKSLVNTTKVFADLIANIK